MKKIACVVSFLLSAFVVCVAFANSTKQNLNVVFIGNSISEGALLDEPSRTAPPIKTGDYLRKHLKNVKVDVTNCGVSGSTTVDFLPVEGTLFAKVQQAADHYKNDESALLMFSVMLGTNDSAIRGTHGAPVSAGQYRTNMKAIIDKLLALYPDCKIVLNYPIWYSPNTYNGAMYLVEGQKRLKSYYPELDGLIQDYAVTNPGQVYKGDTKAYDYFKDNYLTDFFAEDGNAGVFYLHPNAKGGSKLAEFWGKALIGIFNSK